MASLRYCSPPPSPHFGFRYSSRVVRAASGAVTIPHTKRGELMKEKMIIREKLLNLEPPQPSSYDTAWVAMVPAPGCPHVSHFPQCLHWILQNQRSDGSWGIQGRPEDEPSLVIMDALSSTLACVLALRTWGVGDEHVRKGLRFIGHNMSSVMDMHHESVKQPVGFRVIFPAMLERCIGMGLEMPITQADVDRLLSLRDKELQSMACGSKASMAYVAEGLGNSLDWNEAVAAYQRKNGSFFNTPSTTAAAAIYNSNGRALEYLDSLISLFGSSVPTVYPRNFYARLRMVDALEKTGISPSFSDEINYILDMTHTSWLANDEEIKLDITACAMAFRLLRMHGYDISADGLAHFSEESGFLDSIQGCLNDTEALVELQKASQVQILQDEMTLTNIRSWSAKLLKQQLCSKKISRTVDPAEVEHVLKYPFYKTLERLEHRRNIEHFRTAGIQMLKSAHRSCLPDEEIVSLAADDFHSTHTVYQEELRNIESWVKELRLHELEFARVIPPITFLFCAQTMPARDLSEARIALLKNSILITVIDDLFDLGDSREEMENIVKLIEMWDAHDQVGFCSEKVEILFRAIYDTNIQLGAKAAAIQKRSVMNHITELWGSLVRANMVEANWRLRGHVPSYKEYMAVAEPSYGVGPSLLPSLYLVGPELPEDVINGQEYNEMVQVLTTCGRLNNDLGSYEREKKQGKINSVLLLAREGCGSIDAAKREASRINEASRIQLLRLVLNSENAVPWACRQAFWNLCTAMHRFYVEVDGYASPKEMMHEANDFALHPLRLIPLRPREG